MKVVPLNGTRWRGNQRQRRQRGALHWGMAAQAGKLWDSPESCFPLLNRHVSAAPLCLISISVQQSKSIWEHGEVKD